MKPDQYSSTVDNSIESAVNAFLKGADSTENGFYRSVLSLVKELTTNPDGTIKQTQANIKLAAQIQARLNSVILTDAYRKRVGSYLGEFDAVKQISDTYFSSLTAAYSPNNLIYEQVLTQSITATKNSLIGAGIDEQIIKPVQKILNQNITTGGHFDDLVEQLRLEIKGDAERLGHLRRYSSQITWDALQQYNRENITAVSTNLGLEWYRYSSGLKGDSRSYCKKRQGRYFHKKEVEDSARERWDGKIPGTNSTSIFNYAGGYSCKHHYTPVMIEAVPKSVIDRNIANGNYKPEGKPEIPKEKQAKVVEKKPVKKPVERPKKEVVPKAVKKDIGPTTNYKDAQKQSTEFFNKKGQKAKDRINDYTSVSNKYNQPLRNMDKDPRFKAAAEKYKKDVSELSNILNDAPKFRGKSYRGMALNAEDAKLFNAQLKKGNLFSDRGFMSTSINKKEASKFTGGYDFEYTFAINGKNGVPLSGASRFAEENEILFDVNSKFSIKNIVKKGNKFEIEMDEL